MQYPRDLLHSLQQKYAGWGATTCAAKIVLDGVGMSYYECAVAFAEDTPLAVIAEADREIAEHGYVGGIQMHMGRPVIVFPSNVHSAKPPKTIGANV